MQNVTGFSHWQFQSGHIDMLAVEMLSGAGVNSSVSLGVVELTVNLLQHERNENKRVSCCLYRSCK